MKKLSMTQLIEQADSAKKVNPLDLSSDQDLTVALMNLIVLEENYANYAELMDVITEIRRELMVRVVKKSDLWCVSKHLLGGAMRLIGDGNKTGNYDFYNRAYELYSLFWGLNMGLIDMSVVKKVAPDVIEQAMMDTEHKK